MIVLLDACVLYPASLRDLFLELALQARIHDLFFIRWTEEIQEEWINNLLERRKDLTRDKLDRTKSLMDSAFEDCEVLVTNYEHRISDLELPDPDDRHVLAAAIECGAQFIVTVNVKDFPVNILKKQCSVIAKHPDNFLCELFDDNEELVKMLLLRAIDSILSRLKNPPKDRNELLNDYRRLGLTMLADRIERNSDAQAEE